MAVVRVIVAVPSPMPVTMPVELAVATLPFSKLQLQCCWYHWGHSGSHISRVYIKPICDHSIHTRPSVKERPQTCRCRNIIQPNHVQAYGYIVTVLCFSKQRIRASNMMYSSTQLWSRVLSLPNLQDSLPKPRKIATISRALHNSHSSKNRSANSNAVPVSQCKILFDVQNLPKWLSICVASYVCEIPCFLRSLAKSSLNNNIL